MEIISLIMSFIFGASMMLLILCIIAMAKDKEPMNNVHFYVARDKDGDLNLFLNKPSRSYSLNKWKQYNFYKLAENKHKWIATRIVEDDYFKDLGLNPKDFENLKFEDEPVEVFLNLEN